MFACLYGEGDLTSLAFEFSPVVERSAPKTVTLDASGLERLFGFPQDLGAALGRRAAELGVQVRIALAANPDAAICAARGFAGISVVPEGDEAKFLGELPLALLSPTQELLDTLERWGIRRFQEMAGLPPLGIAERLGAEGLRLRELARGEAHRKLTPLALPLTFEGELELEYPVDLLEPLMFLLARLLNGLTTRLATRGLATNELRLRLGLENRSAHERTLRLPVPALDGKAFLKLIQLDLEAHPADAPVVHIRMGMNPVKPQAAQNGLFLPAAPEPVRLQITLARIQAIVGEGRVGSPEVTDTHRPDAFRMVEFGRAKKTAIAQPEVRLGFCMFRPRRPASVKVQSGQPNHVAADGIRGKVVELAGPWRMSGDWWTTTAWSRDTWDIALSDGGLYRIYCEPRGWFVEGRYD
jgi:protein ImuB